MNNFDYLLSLSPDELANSFAMSFCAYANRGDCMNANCHDCFLRWLNEKHNGSGLTEYEKIHSSSLKKFAKDYAGKLCSCIDSSNNACINNSMCLLLPFKCTFEWLNQEYMERKE